MTWRSTGVAFGAFPAGSMREVHVDGTPILLVRVAERVHALDAICPHEGGILADGTLEGDALACPVHGATFDVRDGSVVADPDGIKPPQGGVGPVGRYPIRVLEDMIEVDLAEG